MFHMRPLFRILLWPVSLLYGVAVRFRNHLYNIGYKKSFTFDRCIISVGNLSIGGNGKTPMVEYLVRLISPNYQLAVLSRGYGRNTKGFKFVNEQSSSQEVGDEPLQMYKKFYPKLTVAVAESRALAIPRILLEQPEIKAVVLDDAFQHRTVTPQLSIVVTDYWSPFYQDHLLPVGRLREPRAGISRADVVVMTKCPMDMDLETRATTTGHIKKFNDSCQVFYTAIEYGVPLRLETGEKLSSAEQVLLVSGIAKSNTLVQFVSMQYHLVEHLKYMDHHDYSEKDLGRIEKQFNTIDSDKKIILTTEKDMIRLLKYRQRLKHLPLYYLPIECVFLGQRQKFDETILNSFSNN